MLYVKSVLGYTLVHVQAMAAGLHSCGLELNISIKSRPGLLQPTFCRSDNANMNVGMDLEDLLEGLWINKFIFDLHAGDWAISTPKTGSRSTET